MEAGLHYSFVLKDKAFFSFSCCLKSYIFGRMSNVLTKPLLSVFKRSHLKGDRKDCNHSVHFQDRIKSALFP